ncbi:MAG: zeta toxin family protein [Bacteroidota bacterium]
MHERKLYLLAGCNGAGKTTAAFTLLPEVFSCLEFINADEIARGLSPLQPETVSMEAGRIMLNRIDSMISSGKNFAFETTLATGVHHRTIIAAKEKGYTVTLLFFWLESVKLAKERVMTRVQEGGHNIPPDVIDRRYRSGIERLFSTYLPVVDHAFIIDNSFGQCTLIAQQSGDGVLAVTDAPRLNLLKGHV